MKTIRVAAGLLLLYAGATILNLGAWVWYSGITEPALRILLRVTAASVAAIGLCWRQRWAWWLGLITTAWLVASGVLAVASGQLSGLDARRPYPLLDYVYFIVAFAAALGAAFLLLTRSSRAAVRAHSPAPAA
jgi:hypothetical protein